MKFTNGIWLIKDNFIPTFGVEYYDYCFDGKNLDVYISTKHIEQRGDSLNSALLTVRFSSPSPDVICIKMSHFTGAKDTNPKFYLNKSQSAVTFKEDNERLVYTSGALSVIISKKKNLWNVKYYNRDEELTHSQSKCIAQFVDRSTRIPYTMDALSIDVDESLYGFGEKFTPFVKNGQVVTIWNEDGGTGSELTYKSIPFYISNKGYGVFVNSSKDVSFEVASEKVEMVQFSQKGESLEYYIINGPTMKNVLTRYTQLTGLPPLPPAWSFGLWLTTSFTTSYDEKTTAHFIEGMKERDIPLSVFHFDCYWMSEYEWCNFKWDSKTFPNPKEMLTRYHDLGLKICIWINPYIAQKSNLFEEGMNNGYLVKKIDGSVWQTDLWQSGMALVDFTNPDATLWFKSKLKVLLDQGVDCFKTDFGERIPVKDIKYFNDSNPLGMHNYYTYLYNKAVFELLKEIRGKNEAVLFARSATVGGQQFPVHWGGDSKANYQSMAETLRGGLSLALSGFSFWSHDIGGFESIATPDLYKRWCQFGLLSSHSRLHGSSSYRVPWLFDEESCDVLRKFVKLKLKLMPYLYSKAVYASQKGIPIMRPMVLEFSCDMVVATLDKQYMLGNSLLVAPIFKDSSQVDFYLPKGTWFNILTKKEYEGNSWYKEKYSYMDFPLLVRENSILMWGSVDTLPDYDYSDGLTLSLSKFTEGAKACELIYSIKGQLIATVTAEKTEKGVEISIIGKLTNVTVNSYAKQIIFLKEGNKK